MIRNFLIFFLLSANCLAQNSNFNSDLDGFLLKEAKHIKPDKISAIKKAVYNIELFKNKELLTTNVDSLYDSATNLIKKQKLPGLLAWTYADHGAYHYNLGFYNKSLNYFLNSYNLVNTLNEEKLFKPIEVYQKNGYFLGEIGDHDRSIELLKKAVKKSDTSTRNYGTLLNVIGRYYYRKGDLKNAKIYFNKTLEYSNNNNDNVRKSKVLGDFAFISEDNKEYKKAEELWLQNIYLSEKEGDKKHVMYARLHLGKLYVKTKQIEKAKDVITKAEDYILSKNHLQYFLYQVKEEQLKIAKLTSNDKKELATRRYLDSLKIVLEKKESSTLNKTINFEIENQNFQQKLENQKVKLQKEQLIKWASIIVLLLIALLFFSIYIASRRKFKLKMATNEEFISRVKLQKLASEQNLAKATHSLLSYKTYLQEKNQQIEQLEEEIQKIQNQTSLNSINHKNELESLLSSHLMTDENWQRFKKSFINEYQSFYEKLIQENDNITETNLRIIFLHKLQLSNQEISNLLGIGIAGVKKSKQRLRKKIANFDDL